MSALTLVRRARVADLVGVNERREASGVLVRDGLLLVVCDNTSRMAILDPELGLPGPHREIPYAVDGGAATRTSPPTPQHGGCSCWSKPCRTGRRTTRSSRSTTTATAWSRPRSSTCR